MRKRTRTFPKLGRLAALALGTLSSCAATAAASLQWSWHYEGTGITASGTLTTNDVADSAGYFQITAISGTRNGTTITRLQPTGTAIPGNEPYTVDNLLRASGQQLTENGFGFALADGTFSNPFFAHTQTLPTYLEFSSTPLSVRTGHSELPVHFTAQLMKPARANPSGAHLR